MTNALSPGMEPVSVVANSSRLQRCGLFTAAAAASFAVLTALFVPAGYLLAACGDTLQLALLAASSVLALQNLLRSQSRIRIFWFLTFLGVTIWTASSAIWWFYEILLNRPVPTTPLADMMLFVLIVPLTTAFAAAPHRQGRSPFRAFGLLDVSVLMIYALYLYGLGVFSYLLLPNSIHTYNFRFDVADSVGNHIFLVGAAVALLASQGPWRTLYRLYFLAAAGSALSSAIINTAIDAGTYHSGGFYDLPLVISLSALLCVMLQGRTLLNQQSAVYVNGSRVDEAEELPGRAAFFSSHLAMLVVLSTPLIGILLLSSTSAPLLHFRLTLTLATMLVLVLLLSVKQDLLTAGLFSSLARLSGTYSSIERFKSRLTQSEKMASLGESVAEVANQIKQCMAVILDIAARLSSGPSNESRVQSMAGKIVQYAQRTDALVDNMLRFAQETPMRITSFEIKPLLESALQLSRVAKLPNIHVKVIQEGECPQVRADSGQILHVFLELISNAVDALQEVNGGTLEIKILHTDSHVRIEFDDSGPGIRNPARVFEPFYTTKVVGKGTGLGLSTCYGILQQHQGEITCRNRLTGGASFSVSLPLVAHEPSEKSSSNAVLVEGAS
jgi:signal transduction histidine kinase